MLYLQVTDGPVTPGEMKKRFDSYISTHVRQADFEPIQ
jgi:hypothetical protein